MARHPDRGKRVRVSHQGTAAGDERGRGEPIPSEPYPFVYSRDPWDERRFAGPGYWPTSLRPSRFGRILSWTLGIVILAIIVAGLISVIAGGLGR